MIANIPVVGELTRINGIRGLCSSHLDCLEGEGRLFKIGIFLCTSLPGQCYHGRVNCKGAVLSVFHGKVRSSEQEWFWMGIHDNQGIWFKLRHGLKKSASRTMPCCP